MEHRRRLNAGEVVFRAGDLGDVAYLIESGTVEIYLDHAEGIQTIAHLGSHALFGEMALAGDHTRTANARAASDTELLVVTHEMLAEQLSRATPMLRHFVHLTLSRSRDSLRFASHGGETILPPLPIGAEEQRDRELTAQQLRTEQDLRQALESGSLELHYQPIVALDSDRIAGFEALIRWNDRERGLLLPSAFIDVAEQSLLINEIGHWIIDTAAAALAEMANVPGRVPPFCTINLSARQFDDPQLFARIADALQRHALEPQRLRLEITESAAFGNPTGARQLLEKCRALGCPLLVDDFGTGYGTLSYLHRLPIDAIKLDRSFISEITDNDGATAIVRAMTRLAGDLGMYTVAEGIETAEQARRCAQLGVRYGQGFHYSRGVPLPDALTMLRAY